MGTANLAPVETRARENTVAAEAFRAAMRELACGVALATSAFERRREGCAVTSFTSLSLNPPSLLICLNADSATLACARASGAFALNVLAGRHEALARRFADAKLHGAERFAAGDWGALETGAPALRDALAVVDCRLERVVEHATHVILIGAATALAGAGTAPALLHWRGRFEALG